ncbi:unnamed protein product [Brachionus calyciflorus]|uniref:Uncharacterized protein n=1 Tax=Brachionus calyciflorus TaxID=104777 RepID=A0A813V4M4_9BILA|nr:unnamed protein product [Brachionus calyciflorus]
MREPIFGITEPVKVNFHDSETKIEFLSFYHKGFKERFDNLLKEYKDVFVSSLDDLGLPCSLEEHKINKINEKPFFQYPYRKSPKESDLIREEVEKMLKANIIRHSTSPWSAPALMVPKKDGTLRFCVDYRLLNQITIQDPFPVPRTDDVFDRLALSKVFTILDLKSVKDDCLRTSMKNLSHFGINRTVCFFITKLKIKLENDIIEELENDPTTWLSETVKIPKKRTNEIRLCIDTKAVNEANLSEKYEMPTAEDIIYAANGMNIFSKADLNSADMSGDLERIKVSFNTKDYFSG